MEWMPQAVREGILTVLFISGPMVLLAAGLGLTIGVLQAATQVQEQTLGSAVKIIGIFLALIVFGFYMFQFISQYAAESMEKAFRMIPGLSSHPLPPKKLFDQPLKGEEEDHHGPGHEPPHPGEHHDAGHHGSAQNLSMMDEPEYREVNHDHHEETVPMPDAYEREESELQEQQIDHQHQDQHEEPQEQVAPEPEPVVQQAAAEPEPEPEPQPAPARQPAPRRATPNLNQRPANLPVRRVPKVDLNSQRTNRAALDRLKSRLGN